MKSLPMKVQKTILKFPHIEKFWINVIRCIALIILALIFFL